MRKAHPDGATFVAARIPIDIGHPATQAWKRQRLAEAELAPPSWLKFVPVDFERDDLGETLGYEADRTARKNG
jgi:O-methyltransferase involved in polyketide biosynthesis